MGGEAQSVVWTKQQVCVIPAKPISSAICLLSQHLHCFVSSSSSLALASSSSSSSSSSLALAIDFLLWIVCDWTTVMWLWSVDLPRTYMHENPIKSKLYGMDICIYGYTDNCMHIHICGDWCGYVPLLYGYRFMIVDICLWIHIYVVTEMDMGLDESEWFVTIITPFPPFSWKSFWQGTSFSHLCWSYFPFLLIVFPSLLIIFPTSADHISHFPPVLIILLISADRISVERERCYDASVYSVGLTWMLWPALLRICNLGNFSAVGVFKTETLKHCLKRGETKSTVHRP